MDNVYITLPCDIGDFRAGKIVQVKYLIDLIGKMQEDYNNLEDRYDEKLDEIEELKEEIDGLKERTEFMKPCSKYELVGMSESDFV